MCERCYLWQKAPLLRYDGTGVVLCGQSEDDRIFSLFEIAVFLLFFYIQRDISQKPCCILRCMYKFCVNLLKGTAALKPH